MKELKDNRNILIILTGINGLVLWDFVSNGAIKHGIGYFIFFYVAVGCIHAFTNRFPPEGDIEVKEPRKELIVSALFALLGLVFLTANFFLKSNTVPPAPMVKFPIWLGVFLFSLPIGIFLYLLWKKYKFLHLGLATKPSISLLLGAIIWGLTGLFAYVFYPDGIIWKEGFAELGGIGGVIVQGIIGAALVEEFYRFVLQSRFEKTFSAAGAHILFATTIWACMHFPMAYHKGENAVSAAAYCIQIIPLGVVWGYLTHRTRSILPSTVAHGLNLWGFQNG